MLIAFLENNLNADGTVDIPEVLRPYMGGKAKLIPNKESALRARSAIERFVHLFKGGRVQGQRPWPPAAAGGTPLCLLVRVFLQHLSKKARNY